jgi:stage III sporulation protein AF
MIGYILSVLGIVVIGVFIDIIIPTGTINKYIKGIYSIFVVVVIINPVVKFLNKKHDFSIKYEDYQADNKLLDYIFSMRSNSLENCIESSLNEQGFSNIDIILKFSIENNELKYNSCSVNLKNMVISSDKQHINKYEFIKKRIKENTGLTDEEIIIHD